MKYKHLAVLSSLLTITLLLQGCVPSNRDALPVHKGSLPLVIDPGADTYTNKSDQMSTIAPEPQNSKPSNSGKKDAFLAKDLCSRVGENAIQFSKVSAEQSGGAFIAKLLDFDLVADNRETVSTPAVDAVAVVVECRVLVELSTGDRGSVTIYELLDSDGMSRVRWDNYTPE